MTFLLKVLVTGSILLMGCLQIATGKTIAPETTYENSIYFHSGSDTWIDNEDSRRMLDNILNFLHTYPKYGIRLDGHCDDAGYPVEDTTFSIQRTKSVKRWLVQRGIDPCRIRVRGFGGTAPDAPNVVDGVAIEGNRKVNRRVEFLVDTEPARTKSEPDFVFNLHVPENNPKLGEEDIKTLNQLAATLAMLEEAGNQVWAVVEIQGIPHKPVVQVCGKVARGRELQLCDDRRRFVENCLRDFGIDPYAISIQPFSARATPSFAVIRIHGYTCH